MRGDRKEPDVQNRFETYQQHADEVHRILCSPARAQMWSLLEREFEPPYSTLAL